MSGLGESAPVIVAGHLATIGATLLLVAVWIAVGGRVLDRLQPERHGWPAPLPLVTKALLGQGLVALVGLALGAVGLLRPAVVLGVLGLAVFLLRRDLAALAGALRGLSPGGGPLRRVAVGAWAALALLMVVLALAPPWDWDTLMYHQALPLEFLRSGSVDVPTDNLHVGVIGVAQFASLPLLAAGLTAGPAMASVASYLLLAGAMLALARVAGDDDDGWWSLLLLVGTPAFLLVATTARVDVTVTGALVVAHAVLLLAAGHRGRAELVVAAICFGFAAGMKLHAVAYAAACAPVALVAWKHWRVPTLALGACVLVAAPWLLKNAILVGAPFYPLGAPPRLEPWLAAIAGSEAIPAGFDTRALAQLGESRTAFNLWDAFFHPDRVTIEGEGRFYGLPVALLLLPISLFVLRRRPAGLMLALPPLGYLALVVLAAPHTNLRYLFPAIPPLVVASVIGVRAALARPLRGAWHRAAVGLALGLSAVTLFPAAKERLGPGVLLLRWAAGAETRAGVRARFPDVAARDIAALDQSLAGLGREALVLLFWEARTGGLRARALADVRLSNWPLLNQTAAAESCLARTGITHVVINRRSLEYYIGRGASAEVFRVRELREFIDRCLMPLSEVRSYLIFRVRRPAGRRCGTPQRSRGAGPRNKGSGSGCARSGSTRGDGSRSSRRSDDA